MMEKERYRRKVCYGVRRSLGIRGKSATRRGSAIVCVCVCDGGGDVVVAAVMGGGGVIYM